MLRHLKFTGTGKKMCTDMVHFGLLGLVKSLSTRPIFENDNNTISAKTLSVIQLVDSMELDNRKWRITFETGNANIKVELHELWRYSNIIATEGLVYLQLRDESVPVRQGHARFSLLIRASDIVVQGSYEVNRNKHHLYRKQGEYVILDESKLNRIIKEVDSLDVSNESELPIQPIVSNEELSLPENMMKKRESADSENPDVSSWPTFSDLMGIVPNGTACYSKLYLAPIGIVVDSNFIDSFESTDAAQLHIIDTVNKASQIWENAFNISLQLSEMILGNSGVKYSWDIPCNNSDNSVQSLETRLKILQDWRQSTRSDDKLALWSLFSNCPSSDVIGLAWQSSVCEPSGSNIIHHSLLDYQILSHECGHVFGAVHDCINTTCTGKTMDQSSSNQQGLVCCPYSSSACDSNGRYIMSPGSDILQQSFSKCTQANICAAISNLHVNSSCLILSKKVKHNTDVDCVRETDPIKYRQCWRDAQCWSITNKQTSSSCGSVYDCTLSCFNHQTNKCDVYNVPLAYEAVWGLNEGIRNSSCVNTYTPGSSMFSSIVPIWGWVLIGISGILCFLMLLAMILMTALKLREKNNESNEDHSKHSVAEKKDISNNKSKAPLKIGPPTPQSKIINRDPISGIPPILPYNTAPIDAHSYKVKHKTYSLPSIQTSSSSSYSFDDDKNEVSLDY